MHWWIGIGSGCLGLLIGGLVALYITNATRFSFGALTGAVSTLAGAGVLDIFHLMAKQQGPPPDEYWAYPIGLLLGAVIMGLLTGKFADNVP